MSDSSASGTPSSDETPPADAPTSEVVATEAVTPEAAASPAPSEPAASESAVSDSVGAESAGAAPASLAAATASAGPINLARVRELRMSQQQAAPKPAARPAVAKEAGKEPSSGKGSIKTGSITSSEGGQKLTGDVKNPADGKPRPFRRGDKRNRPETGTIKTPESSAVAPKIQVPSRRQALPKEMEDELSAALGGADLDKMLVGDDMLQVGHMLEEGQRIQAKVMKAQGEFIFLGLGGPNEAVVASIQFETPPEVGSAMEVVVRGYLADEGLYEVSLPGSAVSVADWDDLAEGEVVEAVVTAANAGGLECKVGAIRGFIPASQVAEYRVEDLAEMVDEKVLCVVTEVNPRRGNLVLSRRAVLEREKQEKRAERLAALTIGDAVEGTVTKIMDFGAFVDIGGLDGLLHISQLSYERVNHPSEILEQGQKIEVRIDKMDEKSGKIGLSYRSLQEHPWTDIDQKFPVGSMVKGTVTRIAEFGAFVRIATGVEGLVHISELAHHRVSNVASIIQEQQEVDVKVLSVDIEAQRMSLSIKAAQAAPEPKAGEAAAVEVEEPPAKPVLPKHRGPLKGGTARPSGGEHFGLKW